MRELFDIASASGSHPILLSEGSLAQTVKEQGGKAVLADIRFEAELADLTAALITMAALEDQKTLERATVVIADQRRRGTSRGDRLVAVGGGIVQDVGCFSASVYMRGLDWIYVPTTLLAMVDSCIGGKSSINVGGYKNLAGSFFPPKAVIIVPTVVSSLSEVDIVSGLCEAAKISYARGSAEYARYLELHASFSTSDPQAVGALVAHALHCKKWFVETDEFDQAERLILNFGHSYGHALESATRHGIPHGVAVGVGMLSAIRASSAFGGADETLGVVASLDRHLLDLLRDVDALPSALASVERNQFFDYFDGDKKHSSDRYRLILLAPSGALIRQDVSRDEAGRDAIWEGFLRARNIVTTQSA